MSTSDSSSAEWYYSDEGRQSGPVSLSELQERARSGRLNPARDLVWNSSLPEWIPAGRVPELFPGGSPAGVGANPYAPPVSAVLSAPPPEGMLPEIPPGSQPPDAMECVKRAFTLVNRSLVPLVLVALVYVLAIMIVQIVVGFLLVGGLRAGLTPSVGVQLVSSIVGSLVGTYLALGMTRVVLNVVSGREFSVSLLVSEGGKFVQAVIPTLAAGVLITLLSVAGFLGLLVGYVAFVWAWIRFGQYLALIVDRNLGTMESLQQSYRLTQNSGLQLLGLNLLSGLVMAGGVLACGVGVLYTMPVFYVAQALAYRWLQYGPVALADDPSTGSPVLRGRIPE